MKKIINCLISSVLCGIGGLNSVEAVVTSTHIEHCVYGEIKPTIGKAVSKNIEQAINEKLEQKGKTRQEKYTEILQLLKEKGYKRCYKVAEDTYISNESSYMDRQDPENVWFFLTDKSGNLIVDKNQGISFKIAGCHHENSKKYFEENFGIRKNSTDFYISEKKHGLSQENLSLVLNELVKYDKNYEELMESACGEYNCEMVDLTKVNDESHQEVENLCTVYCLSINQYAKNRFGETHSEYSNAGSHFYLLRVVGKGTNHTYEPFVVQIQENNIYPLGINDWGNVKNVAEIKTTLRNSCKEMIKQPINSRALKAIKRSKEKSSSNS